MKKKILSLALALVMVLTLFPVTVSAAYDNYERNLKQYNESPVKPKVLEMLSNMEFEYIDEIVDLARSIVEGISSDYDKAKAIHYWVAENIWYGGPVGDVLYSSLAHVLKYRRGVCGHYADLTLALLRASGIPALHVVGAINSITDVGHSWVEAYADNRWIIMDPTWDSQNRYENHPEKRSARGVYFDISLEEISKSHLMGAYWDRDNEVFNPYYISLRNEFVVDVKIHKGSIGDYTFSGYTNLSTVTIGNGVTHIGEGAFTGLSITSIVVPGSVKQIDRAAFSVCENLETVTIQDGVTSIGNSMFLACTSLTSVSLPNSLKSIEDYAFARSSLSHIVIPDGVTSIGDLAFSNCDNLTSVVIPESVTNIGGHVFHITIWSDGAYTIYPIPGLTIYGKAGSYAETYAKDNNIPFKVGFPPNPIDTASSWAREGITAAIGKGFVPNQLQTKYTNVITRAEFCRMAVKWVEYALGKPIAEIVAERGIPERAGLSFGDTTDQNILAAYRLGITAGSVSPTADKPGTFNPDGQFTRQEAATMIMNTCRAIGTDVSNPPTADFGDMDKAAGWAQPGINFVRAKEIMNGDGVNFNPGDMYSREQSIITFNNIKHNELLGR